MIKKIFLILIILMFAFFVIFILIKNRNTQIIKILDSTVLKSKTTTNLFNTRENIYIYENKDLIYKITERILSNDDVFYFIQIDNLTSNSKNIKLKISMSGNISYESLFDKLDISREFSNSVGYDKTTNPIGYFEFVESSIILGKDYIYKSLTSEYEQDGYSIIRELLSEKSDYIIFKDYIIKNILLDADASIQSFLYYSKEKLLNNQTSISKYEEFIKKGMTSIWNSGDGRITKVAYSIDPFTREGYAINLSNIFEKKAFELDDNSRLFFDLVESSVFSIMNYVPKNDEGLFLTEYTSTWVMKPFGIYAPYIDTRHNENLGLILHSYGLKNDIDILSEYYLNYSNFLLKKFEEKKYMVTRYGILFYDYYSLNNQEKYETHASLNHQVGIMNYLFKSYINTKNTDYYDLAMRILNTLTNIGKNWIRNNGDLWYKIDVDGSFSEQDYVFVTFEDLIQAQELIVLIDSEPNKTISMLINSKYEFLKSNNINIENRILEKYNKIK